MLQLACRTSVLGLTLVDTGNGEKHLPANLRLPHLSPVPPTGAALACEAVQSLKRLWLRQVKYENTYANATAGPGIMLIAYRGGGAPRAAWHYCKFYGSRTLLPQASSIASSAHPLLYTCTRSVAISIQSTTCMVASEGVALVSVRTCLRARSFQHRARNCRIHIHYNKHFIICIT